MTSLIQVKELRKEFITFKKRPGFKNAVRDFFKREKLTKIAVDSINFEVKKGEFLGFLGPNGAGKTTTLKMLSGILTPTSGEAKVMGYTPWERKIEFKQQFAMVMGQKGQLWWDLPPLDSYELFRYMYELSEKDYKKQLMMLTDLLDLGDAIETPTRKLSLGQRMKAELIGALLHKPKVLFLDEPTIGLDLVAQQSIRSFLKDYNRETKATILLTSHYMEDIRQLCERVVIIDKGRIIYDGGTQKLIKKFAQEKSIELSFSKQVNKKDVQKFGSITSWNENRATLEVPREDCNEILAKLLKNLPIEDLSVHEQSMEEIVGDIFKKTHEL